MINEVEKEFVFKTKGKYQVSNKIFLDLIFNNNCNCDCRFCIAKTKSYADEDFENWKKSFKRTIEIFKEEIDSLIILGGEATVDPNFFKKLEYIDEVTKDNHIFTILTTNGCLLRSDSFLKRVAESSIDSITGFFKSIGSSIKGIFSKNNTNSNKNIREDNKIKNEVNNEIKDENKNKSIDNNNIKNEIKEENKEKIKEINIKDLINDQNFVEGYQEINENTEKVKENYQNEFKLLKELKDKNINDNIAITILIIYFIIKEHSELLNELFMIIEKN